IGLVAGERALGLAPLEAREPEEDAALVEEEEERVAHPIARVRREVREARALGRGVELVGGIDAPRRLDDALALEPEGLGQAHPRQGRERLGRSVDDTGRVRVGPGVLGAQAEERAARGYELPHGVHDATPEA